MKKTPSLFTARVEIEQQISFFSFGLARVSEVRHIFPIDSYVQIMSEIGILSCSFSDILTLVEFMQINVHPRSF